MSAGFAERHAEVGGRRVPYLEAGAGPTLVHVPGAGRLQLTPAHETLAHHLRVVVVDLPESERSALLAPVVRSLGVDTVSLMGSSSGSAAALALALDEPQRVHALVLEAPTALSSATSPRAPATPSSAAALEARLAELAMPTLVLLGTADAEVTPTMGRVYKERIPSCHLVYVYAAGHAIGAERPEAFAEVVLDFLERREAFVISRDRTLIHP